MPSDIEKIAATVYEFASPGMKPKALFKAVREKHPEASKQDVTRAAFYAVIAHADADPDKATQLQGIAIAERGSADEPRKKDKNRKADRSGPSSKEARKHV